MLLERKDPFLREFDRVSQRVFEAGVGHAGGYAPMDVVRHDDEIVLRFDLPGAAADSVDLTVQDNTLTMHATRLEEHEEGAEFLIRERHFSEVTRRVTLPEWVDGEGATAEFNNGVLSVRLPMREQAKPRRIEVRDADTKAIAA